MDEVKEDINSFGFSEEDVQIIKKLEKKDDGATGYIRPGKCWCLYATCLICRIYCSYFSYYLTIHICLVASGKISKVLRIHSVHWIVF